MTLEEAYEELKVIYAFCHTEPIFQEAINMIIKDHVEKRWHDLQELPFDRPPADNVPYLAYNDSAHCEYTICRGWALNEKGLNEDIIAWKAIDKFIPKEQ